MFCGIYVIINTINNKLYIGSSKDVKSRWRSHKQQLRLNKHYNQHLQNAWNKYGEQAFTFEIEELCEEKDLLLIEECFIAHYMCWDSRTGYNLTKTPTRPKHNSETCKLISLGKQGSKNPNFGKHLSKEHCEKIRQANKGQKRSKEFCIQASLNKLGEKNPNFGKPLLKATKAAQLANTGKHQSLETRTKKSLALTKEKHPMYGKPAHNRGIPCKEETKKKISVALKQRNLKLKQQEKQDGSPESTPKESSETL